MRQKTLDVTDAGREETRKQAKGSLLADANLVDASANAHGPHRLGGFRFDGMVITGIGTMRRNAGDHESRCKMTQRKRPCSKAGDETGSNKYEPLDRQLLNGYSLGRKFAL